MTINNTEINGFTIDQFNQYDLEVGKKGGTCPLCSADRKPENRKSKCAMYDWERGLGTCHNCNETFQLHTYERKVMQIENIQNQAHHRKLFSTILSLVIRF